MATTFHSKPLSPLGRKVFIATPSFSGGPCAPYTLSLLETIKESEGRNISIEWCLLTANCHVDDSRNYLVRDFLESDCDDFFFIDADVGWEPDDFFKLVNSPHDFCAGVYPKKNDVADYPVMFFDGVLKTDKDGWMKVKGVPTGFLKITRSAVQKLYDAESREFNSIKDYGRLPQRIIFERTFDGVNRISGDYSACNKWLAMGGDIYIDPEFRFVHEGTKEWSGTLGHHLREKNGLTDGYITALIDKVKAGDYTEKDLYNLYVAYDNNFSAPPDLMASWALLLENADGDVLEIGSGMTTVIAAAIATRKDFKLTSIEHDKEWLIKVEGILRRCNLESDILYCPIEDGWYSFKTDKQYDIVFIDGPPRVVGREGFNAHQHLIKDGATVLADDMDSDIGLRIDGVEFTRYCRWAIGVKK